jgi:UMP-CMP kinase 2
MAPPTIYRNVESVLNVLNSYKGDNTQGVNALLQIYSNALNIFKENDKKSVTTKTHPFIILEGLDGCGKSTTAKRLAKTMHAVQWCTPPESIKHIRHLFDDHPQLRSAYYALGNYIAALEVSVLLKQQPVVMDRYWHSTAAFAIAQAVHDFPQDVDMPPEGDKFYEWPQDLLKPNAVLFLHVTEDVRLQRLSRRTVSTSQEKLLKSTTQFRDNIILAYRNMINPEAIFINSNNGFTAVISEIKNKIDHLFQ